MTYESTAINMVNDSRPVLNASLVINELSLRDPEYLLSNNFVMLPLKLDTFTLYQSGLVQNNPNYNCSLSPLGKGAHLDLSSSSQVLAQAFVDYIALRSVYGRAYKGISNDMMILRPGGDSLLSTVSAFIDEFLRGASKSMVVAYATTLFYDENRQNLLSIPVELPDVDHDNLTVVDEVKSYAWSVAECAVQQYSESGFISSRMTQYAKDFKRHVMQEFSLVLSQGKLKDVADEAVHQLSGIVFSSDLNTSHMAAFLDKNRFYHH